MEVYNQTFRGDPKVREEDRASDMTSMRFDDTYRSQDVLLNPGREAEDGSVLIELNKLGNPDESFDDEYIKVLVSEEVKEVTPNDFGYYTLFHTGNENLDNQLKHCTIRNERNETSQVKFYVPGNFVGHLNRKVKSPGELFLHFVKNQDPVSKKLNLENPVELLGKRNNKLKEFVTKKMSQNQSMKEKEKEENEGDELILNTLNSRVKVLQKGELDKGKSDSAIKMNFDYSIRKAKYECDLVQSQIDKYEQSQKRTGNKASKITDPKPYTDLKKNSDQLMKKYKEFISSQKLSNPNVKNRLEQFAMQARIPLVEFMAAVLKTYDKYMSDKRATNDKGQSYIKWKSKLSQLVGIWDLANSNGTEIKVSSKYLTLKRLLTMRSIARQEDKDFIIFPEEKKSGFGGSSGGRNANLYPSAVFLDRDTIKQVMDVVMAIILLYTFFTVPLRLLLGYETKSFKLIEKFIDMYFYIDIMICFRTSFKDKFNEDIFDITEITKTYFSSFFLVDFISTIPWYFFFIANESLSSFIKLVTHLLKIGRILKLLPILNKLEQLKAANYFRLIKLLLIYFLLTHWMACIIIYGTLTTMNYLVENPSCYTSNMEITKFTMNNECKYIFSFYQASYMIPGGYTSYMDVFSNLSAWNEYVVVIAEYLLGQFISAYSFGAITSIIQNLDQGSNFFTAKTDLLREHMIFYDIGMDVQNDVTVYYDYVWLRHKDMIYGKSHFDLLSKSLREKFENFNLVGSEIYLYTFNLLKNPKLIGFVLRELRKKIVFPYEILYEEGSLVPGLYILTNGEVIFTAVKIANAGTSSKSVDFPKVMKEMEKRAKLVDKKYEEVKDMCVIFPLVSSFIKTGRTHQRCYVPDFADLLFLPLEAFDSMITSFPVEMHSLKHEVNHEVERTKLFDNLDIFTVLSRHSARSVGKNYEQEYTKLSIWIPIPIPISQRKIATSYIESFVKKIRNQWREILVNSDLNICLFSIMIVGFLRSDNKKEKKEDNNEKNVLIQQGDQLDALKNISRTLFSLTDKFLTVQKEILQEEY